MKSTMGLLNKIKHRDITLAMLPTGEPATRAFLWYSDQQPLRLNRGSVRSKASMKKLSLTKRVLDLPLPDVATIDLRVDFGGRKRFGPISQKLRQEITQAVSSGGQVILLLNRRGFSTRIQCPGCGKCRNLSRLLNSTDTPCRR